MIEYLAEGLPYIRCSVECDSEMVVDFDGEHTECQQCGNREKAPGVIEALNEYYGDTDGRQDHPSTQGHHRGTQDP